MMQSHDKVWDIFIRIFHWTLVLAFGLSYLTEGEIYLHFYSGWYIALLLIFRLIWGFIGTKHAKFSDFIKPPTEIVSYAKALLNPNVPIKNYRGHNPLGGLMIVGLLLSLSLTCLSGIILYTSEGNAPLNFLGKGPLQAFEEEHASETKNALSLASTDVKQRNTTEDEREEYDEHYSHNKDSEMTNRQLKSMEEDDEEGENESDEFWEEIHEFFANFTLILVLIHITGVIVSSRIHNEKLVKAMITGKKD